MDIPQEQLRAIILPADPVPVWQPRVENFGADETDYRTVLPVPSDPITGLPMPAQTALRITQDCENRITQPIGCPDGLIQDAVMPYNGGVQKAFGTPLVVLSMTSNGTAMINVTFSRPHGLKTNDQISVDGMLAANGFFSVKAISATALSYMTAKNVAAAGLLTPRGRIVTALVGLPYGSVTIPKTDCEPGSFTLPTSGIVAGGGWLAGSDIPAGSG